MIDDDRVGDPARPELSDQEAKFPLQVVADFLANGDEPSVIGEICEYGAQKRSKVSRMATVLQVSGAGAKIATGGVSLGTTTQRRRH